MKNLALTMKVKQSYILASMTMGVSTESSAATGTHNSATSTGKSRLSSVDIYFNILKLKFSFTNWKYYLDF